ncbi:MAG: YfiR family protein [Bacteroidetes bacterium]|nr:YfiR family protein [Bacteroidota bacterium]
MKTYLLLTILFLLGAGEMNRISAQDVDYKSYTLFLYNFMKYIEWPDKSGDFVIGVVGDSKVKTELMVLAEKKKVGGRNIVVKTISNIDDAMLCNMIYVPSEKTSTLRTLLEKIKGKPILVVGEREGLARKGAGISFVVDDDDALKFDINKSVLDSHSLKIANLLMQLGILVG